MIVEMTSSKNIIAGCTAVWICLCGGVASAEPRWNPSLGDNFEIYGFVVLLHLVVVALAALLAAAIKRKNPRKDRIRLAAILSAALIALSWISGAMPMAYVLVRIFVAGRTY
ncbi:MAG: hypothetical protein FJ088_08245 [Deltaproteobacteria bacterium]|nr:hypothetical protein [Deltaproteobacteria bacterium]